MSVDLQNRFVCHLWKITRKSQSAILLSSTEDAAFIPEFPPNIPVANGFVFGTSISEGQNGSNPYNQTCGDTIYWRTQVAVDNQELGSDEFENINNGEKYLYYYMGSTRTRLIAISQTDYNNRILSPLSDLSLQLRRHKSQTCRNIGVSNYVLSSQPNITDFRYEDPNDQALADSVNNDFGQLEITFFSLGQEVTNYGIECEFIASTTNTNYTLGDTYTTDIVGNIQGAIEEIRVYISNGQYAYSVTHNNGIITEPIFITHNSNPIYANNYPGGNVAVALLGIKNIVCKRIDNQTDNGGDRDDLDVGFVETITPLGFTDHDKPIEYDGLTYVPYYGGSISDYEYSASGEAAINEVDFAIALEGISEADLVSGLYSGAKVETHYYDWANKDLIFKDAPGFFGEISIKNSRNKAFKYNVELNSSLSLLHQKEYNIITSYCSHVFGGSDCGVNLLSRGLVDTLTVSSIEGNSIVVNSIRNDNYYGHIEFLKDGIIYSFGVARYTQATTTIETWESIPNLEAGDTIRAIARCERTRSDCKKFQGNMLRFGGFELIPSEQSIRRIRS